jgi:hypothetical protein
LIKISNNLARFEYLSNEKAEMDKTDCITEDSKPEEGILPTPWCPG